MNQSILEPDLGARVMRRVYLIWASRLLLSGALWRLASAVGIVWWLTSYVSFSQVWVNVPKHFWQGPLYAFSAFWGTEHVAQALAVGLMAVAAWLFFDGWQLFSSFYRKVFA